MHGSNLSGKEKNINLTIKSSHLIIIYYFDIATLRLSFGIAALGKKFGTPEVLVCGVPNLLHYESMITNLQTVTSICMAIPSSHSMHYVQHQSYPNQNISTQKKKYNS
jgi:hypothetical protein